MGRSTRRATSGPTHRRCVGPGVELRERTALTGVRVERGRVTGVETTAGPISTERVLLTGGPTLREVGRLAGLEIPAGAVRHQVAVTEPHAAFDVDRLPMVFDLARGSVLAARGGRPPVRDEQPGRAPGPAREIDWPYLRRMRRRLDALVPAARGLGLRRAWAATIDFTPDHLPILGPAITPVSERIDGLWVASPGGHGMMWGPGVSRVAADLVLHGRT